jgi:hypothetical protein
VAKSASSQVSVDGSRVFLEKLSGCVDCLVIRPALYCWKDMMREARQDILDGGVLHRDVLGGPECIVAVLEKRRFSVLGPKKDVCISVLVITSEIHLS